MAAALGVVKVFAPNIPILLRKAAEGNLQLLFQTNLSHSTPLRAAAWIIGVGNLLLLIWTYGFWGAYREINGTTRLHSLAAFGISCIVFLPVGVFFILIQEGLLNMLR